MISSWKSKGKCRLAARSLCSIKQSLSYPDLIRHASPERLALIAPQQGIEWSYGDLDLRVRSLARGLAECGVGARDVAIADVPNIAENLLLQLALGHLGASVATVKDAEALAKLEKGDRRVALAVCATAESFIGSATLPLPPLLLSPEKGPLDRSLLFDDVASGPPSQFDSASKPSDLLAIFGGAQLSHATALALGADAAAQLAITTADRACVSITLCHAFGIGSAVGGALVAEAAVVLPAVGGIRGCGEPKQRAAVTLEVLEAAAATLLFADTHTLRALPEPEGRALVLRGGVVKTGSGSAFLDVPPLQYGEASLLVMGKK